MAQVPLTLCLYDTAECVNVTVTYKCQAFKFVVTGRVWSRLVPVMAEITIRTASTTIRTGFASITFAGLDYVPILDEYPSRYAYKTSFLPCALIATGIQYIYIDKPSFNTLARSLTGIRTSAMQVNLWMTSNYSLLAGDMTEAYYETLYNFVMAFNKKYASLGIAFVGIWATLVPTSTKEVAAFTHLSDLVTRGGSGLQLGFHIAPADSLDVCFDVIDTVNAYCITNNTTKYTSVDFDTEDVGISASVTKIQTFVNDTVVPQLTGVPTRPITRVSIIGGPFAAANSPKNTTAVNIISTAPGLTAPVATTACSFVSIGEIYDMEDSCSQPPVLCLSDCSAVRTTPTADDVSNIVNAWWPAGPATGCPSTSTRAGFMTPPDTPTYGSWGAVSVQSQCYVGVDADPACLQAKYKPGSINMCGVGCNNFSWLSIDQFATFLQAYGNQVATARALSQAPRTVKTADAMHVTNIVVYEGVYLRTAWLQQLGVTLV